MVQVVFPVYLNKQDYFKYLEREKEIRTVMLAEIKVLLRAKFELLEKEEE